MLEVLTGVLCFLNIVDTVFKVRDKIVSKEDKESTSSLLEAISHLLIEVADSLDKNIYPHDKCSEMHYYLNNLQQVLSNKIDNSKILELEKQIQDAYSVEQLLGQLNQLNVVERNNNINLLKSISGSFKAASTLIKL